MKLHESSDPALDVAGLRIVQVVATTTGGTGAHVRMLTEHLVDAGAELVVIAPRQADDQFRFGEIGAAFEEVPIGSLPHPRDALTMRRMRQLTRGADLVHAHSLRAGALAGLAVSRQVPFVITRHNLILATGASRRVHELLERYTAHRADVTMCVSADLVDAVRAAGGEDVRRTFVTAPRLKDPQRDRDAVRADLGVGDRPIVLAVGRLHDQKDYPMMIAAARRLADLDPRPQFLIAGEGPARTQLEGIIGDAPVRLLGESDDIPSLLQAADVLVMTSVWEAGSLAVQEGMRAGLPFVGTRVGAIPDLVADAGLLVRPHDDRALASQIRRVLEEPGLAKDLRDRAVRRAAALPSDADVVEQVLAAYSGARESVRRSQRPQP
jgi:glycosyltransferase involved in cell wall biosynthesis